MAHTDRDSDRVFWRNHHRECERWWHGCEVCDLGPLPWVGMGPMEDSEWRRDCRREERARARNLLQRARSGHLDWDDLTITYRRPYYW
jgi:hypothetical protein